MIRGFVILSLLAFTILACKEDEQEEPTEYRLTVGDTLIVIPAAAVDFAQAQFSIDAYFLREYQVATDEDLPHPGSVYTGTLRDWKALGWNVRQTFLVAPFTAHDVKTEDDAQYLYMIGTYLEQFGYGWRDTFDPEADLDNPAVYIWLHPADSTLTPDNPGTVGFDGESDLMIYYRSMWTLEL